MSELDDALARLERAVARLEAAPIRSGDGGATAAQLAAEQQARDRQLEASTAEIVTRVEAALARIGQVLEEQAPEGEG